MKVVLAIFSTIIAVVIFVLSLNYAGYCVSEQRRLTKGELIQIALLDVYGSVFDLPENVDMSSEEKFKIINEFIDENPNCCNIIRNLKKYKSSENNREKASDPEGYFYPTFWGRIWGEENYLVEVSYVGTRQNSVSYGESAPRIVYRMIGACGHVKRYY